MLKFDMKTWLIAFGIVLLVALWDTSTRIYQRIESVTEKADKALSLSIISPRVNSEQLASIMAMYENFDKKTVAPVTVAAKVQPLKKLGLDAEQQAEQNGLLDKFYIGDQRFILKGIFTDKTRFAVLYRENLTTRQVDELKLELHQMIGNYRVTKISEKQIFFALDDRVVELSIF